LIETISLFPLMLLARGTPLPRSPLVVAAIETGADRYAAGRQAWRRGDALRIVERMEAIACGETADKTFDALFFSGRAEWGAFGGGYAAERKRLGQDAEIRMPELD
jgi:hypothetical protein